MKKKAAKKVVKHLKGDIKMFKKEAMEDKELISSLKSPKAKKPQKVAAAKKPKGPAKPKSAAKPKVAKVMHEFKEEKLRSGSKKGPKVTNPKQAIAIALSEAAKEKKSN